MADLAIKLATAPRPALVAGPPIGEATAAKR